MELKGQDLPKKGLKTCEKRWRPLKDRADSLPEDSRVMISQSTVSKLVQATFDYTG